MEDLKNVFKYEFLEDEGLVSIFANGKLVTELSDDDGDPESVFNWFVNTYSKTNLALNFAGCVNWQDPSHSPEVEKGDEKLFWVAVKVKRPNTASQSVTEKVVTFLAYYQNRPLEVDSEGEYIDDDYLVNECGEPHESIGWVNCQSHCEFDNFYVPIEFDDNYELLGWAEYVAPGFHGPF